MSNGDRFNGTSYQNQVDRDRNFGLHEVNSSSMQSFNANQCFNQYTSPHLTSPQHIQPREEFNTLNFPTRGNNEIYFASHGTNPYILPQNFNKSSSQGHPYNPPLPNSGTIPFLYTPENSSSDSHFRSALGHHIRQNLNEDNSFPSSHGRNCSIPHQSPEPRPSHGVVRNHICPTCGKGFGRPSSLAQHEFIHTGEKPYVCNICQKAFNTTSNLKRHQSLHEKP